MFRTTDTSYWNHPKTRGLPFHAKAIYQYLWTNEYTHISGIYRIKKANILDELDLKSSEFDKFFQILIKNGLVHWDADRQIIWVVSMLEHQIKTRNDKIKAGIVAHLDTLYHTPLIPLFLKYYQADNIPYQYPTDTEPILLSRSGLDQVLDQDKITCTPFLPKPQKGRPIISSVESAKSKAEAEIDSINLKTFITKYPNINSQKEHAKFKDHHLSIQSHYYGKNRTTDWNRAFHTWCRNAVQFKEERHPTPNPQDTQEPKLYQPPKEKTDPYFDSLHSEIQKLIPAEKNIVFDKAKEILPKNLNPMFKPNSVPARAMLDLCAITIYCDLYGKPPPKACQGVKI